MIEINLLQEEKKKLHSRRKVEAVKPLAFLGMIAVVATVLLIDAHLWGTLKGIQKEVAEIKKKRNAPVHLAKLDEASHLETKREKLERKRVIIEELIENRIHWSKKLAALRDSLPSDIWVEKIALTKPANPKDDPFQTLEIGAATLNYQRGNARAAETMESLDTSEIFMSGFNTNLEDRSSRTQAWDGSDTDGPGETPVWRFNFIAKRRLPESELPKSRR